MFRLLQELIIWLGNEWDQYNLDLQERARRKNKRAIDGQVAYLEDRVAKQSRYGNTRRAARAAERAQALRIEQERLNDD